MIRLVVVFLLAVFTAATAAAEGPWSGEWQLSWGNGGALVKLQQDGESVSGDFGSGEILGTVRDDRLTGRIIYNGISETLTVTLDSDGASFAGNTESGDWLNGRRLLPDDPDSAPRIDLTNPRAALYSFLKAAGLAQAGKSYALASALDVINFGSDPGWTTREQRFTGTQQLYQLIDRATFNLSTIPDDTTEPSLALNLPELDGKPPIPITMQRNAQGQWQITMPSPDALRAALDSAKPVPADAYRQLQNPRDTLRAFLEGMRSWENGGVREALDTIDLSHVSDVLRQTEGEVVAQYLVRLIDQLGSGTLQSVPNSGLSREPFVLLELPAGRVVIAPVGTGADTRWKFTADTARQIRSIYRAAEQLPHHHALDRDFIPPSPMFALRDKVKRYAPGLLNVLPGPGRVEYWQVIAAVSALAIVIFAALILRAIFLWVLALPFPRRHVKNPRSLALGLALGIAFLFGWRFVAMIGLPAATRQYSMPIVGTTLMLILCYALWQIVVFVLSVFDEFAHKTDTPLDNILLTFSAGVAKLAIVVGAVMGFSYLWSLPTSGLLAGLGISGLAVAFASKETLSNIFGAGILLGDRPFGKGDRIVAGDINGWVESVGLRSTRIRTLADSILVVPNGKLADMTVNNLGARRRRTLQASLTVTAGASPEKIDALITGIRKWITGDPLFVADSAEVYVSRISSDGIVIDIWSMLETRSSRAGREAAHKLHIDAMQMAERLGMTLGRGMEPVPNAPATAPEA